MENINWIAHWDYLRLSVLCYLTIYWLQSLKYCTFIWVNISFKKYIYIFHAVLKSKTAISNWSDETSKNVTR